MNTPSQGHSSRVRPMIDESIYFDERTTSNSQQNQPSGDITAQFPWRLHQMLKMVEMEGNSSIISWMPGEPQDTFKVHRKEEFMEKIMTRFFNQTKFKSFLRQLNLWGFERILESGPRRGGYRHSLFIKNRPELCIQMKRTRIKGVKHGDSGDSQQQRVARIAAQGAQSQHSSTTDGGAQPMIPATKPVGSPDNTSLETIEYEKIPTNVPVAAELSRMYAEDMTTLNESAEERGGGDAPSAQSFYQV